MCSLPASRSITNELGVEAEVEANVKLAGIADSIVEVCVDAELDVRVEADVEVSAGPDVSTGGG